MSDEKGKSLFYPAIPMKLFEDYSNEFMQVIELQEVMVVGHAMALRDEFISRKKDLHDTLRRDPENNGKSTYSPMTLLARHHNGSLQMTWQEVHFRPGGLAKKVKYYIRIPTVRGVYSLATLRSRATFDQDLVEEIECRARELRDYWRQIMAQKKALYAAIRRLPPGMAARLAEARSMNRPLPRSQGGF